MYAATLAAEDDFDGWRAAARGLAIAEVPPAEVTWRVGTAPGELFGGEPPPKPPSDAGFAVPRPFVELARDVICHSDPARFGLLYGLLMRLRARRLSIEDRADAMVARAETMAKAVRRDIHKMRAFVRFRELPEGAGTRFVAWFEPEHHIVRVNADFFVRRFAAMRWSILTPELCAHWDGEALSFTPGATKAEAPAGEPIEETWATYYASIFNPARLKVGAMMKEMPKKYWKNMPETALVPGLIAGAQAREAGMIEAARATAGGNSMIALEALRDEAKGCTRCHLYKHATQTVFGEGPADAALMLVGEQPGDQEDLAGHPFVGPAGQLLDRALAQAGIDRATTYVTNAVKHFKFEARGKRRIHSKPQAPEIEACHWWLEQERMILRPPVTVALGATAARALLGRVVTIGKTRGSAIALPDGGECWVTVHPSYLLRITERDAADEEFARFVQDLKTIRARVEALAA